MFFALHLKVNIFLLGTDIEHMPKAKAPIYQFIIAAAVGGALTYYVFEKGIGNKQELSVQTANGQTDGQTLSANATTSNTKIPNCDYNMKMRNGFNHVKPLLYSEQDCESANMIPIKEEISSLIGGKISSGLISSASVYIRNLKNGDWTSYNEGETYHPASLNKVAVMITYLHASESSAGLLDKKLLFESHDNNISYQSYSTKTIQPGKSYTVKELLHYMIAYSDNESTILLLKHIDPEFHFKTFTDLGLPKPTSMVGSSALTAKDFSVFMKVLYNATYLSPAGSEFCSDLLTECEFKDGLMKGLPANISIAHKFGEFSDGKTYELHESGIVYNGDNSYIITVMTKGPERKNLTDVIGEISSLVYNSMSNKKPN